MMKRVRDHLPVPMAAPETASLRAARRRLIAALAMLGVLTLGWPLAAGLMGSGALALFGGLLAFISVQGIFWVRAKNAADDAWLLRDESITGEGRDG